MQLWTYRSAVYGSKWGNETTDFGNVVYEIG